MRIEGICKVPFLALVLLTLFTGAAAAALAEQIQKPSVDENGFLVHRINSELQGGETVVRVLLPDSFDLSEAKRVLFVLPVVAGDARRYGDGLAEIRKYGFHNQFDLICVAPEFTSAPWFADHDTNPARRDESYLIQQVIPLIDQNYPTIRSSEGRLLLGFSKSGWGVLTLLLRNPDLFGKASAWDTGILVDTGDLSNEERSSRIEKYFGTVTNFERYRVSNLMKTRGKTLGAEPRIFYYSCGGVRARAGARLHQLMVDLEIPHRYLFEPFRTHRWDSGWIPEAVRFLVGGDQ